MHHLARPALATLATASLVVVPLVSGAAQARPGAAPAPAASAPDLRPTAKDPTAVGKGGAISTVDPEASAAGLKVL